MRFATNGLSISEDCTIEAPLYYTFNKGFNGLFVDKTLGSIRIEHLVVVELDASVEVEFVPYANIKSL